MTAWRFISERDRLFKHSLICGWICLRGVLTIAHHDQVSLGLYFVENAIVFCTPATGTIHDGSRPKQGWLERKDHTATDTQLAGSL